MINHFQNLRPSVLPEKWRFELSQGWETLALSFDSFSMDNIVDKSF